jgi:O-antigen/teichoic acid export membrane protein
VADGRDGRLAPGRADDGDRRVAGGARAMSVRRNMASLLLSQVLTWVVTFALLVEAPDRLGEDAWGALSYASAFVMFFTLVVGLGTSTLLSREIARNPALMSQYVYNAVILKLIIIVIAPVVGIGTALLLGQRGDALWLIIIGFVGVAVGALTEISYSALAGIEVMARPAFFQVLQVYVANGLAIGALLLGFGPLVYGTIFALATLIPCVLSWRMMRGRIHRPFHVDRTVWRLLVRGGIPIMALTVFNMIYGTIDVPILGAITDNVQVGWYGLAYKWVGIPAFIVTAVVAAYFPRFSAHGKPMTVEFPRLVNKALFIVMLAAVPASVGLIVVADDLITLIYKPVYGPTIVLIQILAAQIPIAAMDTVLATALIASDRQSRYLWVSVAAAVFNPPACILMIHWTNRRYDNGAIGAAIVTILTELIVLTGALILRSPGVLDRATLWRGVRIVAAALVIVPAVLAVESMPLAVKIGSGAASYGVALLVFGVASVSEIRSLVSSFTARRQATQID